jgi:hypothetical protein
MTEAIVRALVGGALIGLSATLMLHFNGKVTGISGIVESGLFDIKQKKNSWKVSFIGGLLTGGLALSLFYPDSLINSLDQNFLAITIGGALVGFGTRLGNGCTSGHGVCGVSRLSKRSIAATLTFMFAGFITVAILYHVLKIGGQ